MGIPTVSVSCKSFVGGEYFRALRLGLVLRPFGVRAAGLVMLSSSLCIRELAALLLMICTVACLRGTTLGQSVPTGGNVMNGISEDSPTQYMPDATDIKSIHD
jgi:hypothetical protein